MNTVRIDWRYCKPFRWTYTAMPVVWSLIHAWQQIRAGVR